MAIHLFLPENMPETSVLDACFATTWAPARSQKRWPVEFFYKSLKQKAALGKASVRRVTTQDNHVFAALYAVFKLERLKIKHHLNHFALCFKLYLKALRVAYDELQLLKAA